MNTIHAGGTVIDNGKEGNDLHDFIFYVYDI